MKSNEERLREVCAQGPVDSLLYELPSIIQPLELARMFADVRPLEVELGCGDASFLLECAAAHPERNFIGVERLLGRLRKLERKGRRIGLKNLRGIRIENGYFLDYLLPPHSASALHIYFPDPWPKRRHSHHRLINEAFPARATRALAPGGMVYLRTDNLPYFEEMLRVFEGAREFRAIQTPPELASFTTDFERDFVAKGLRIFRAAFARA